MRQIPPLRLKDAYFKSIEREIKRLFDALIFDPIIKATGIPAKKEIKNAAADPLAEAIAAGQVWYEDGLFKGSFNSKISRRLREIGATYNPRSRTWSLPPLLMPPEISVAFARAESGYQALRQHIITALAGVDIQSINVLSNLPDKYIQTINWMEGDFQKTVRAITIPPNLTDDQRGIIAAEWGQNLDLYIKDWIAQDILDLRKMVMEETFKGNRAESMVKAIQHNYGVSRRKAEFLARQETSLLMSKFRETRYRDIGSTTYRWSTSHDERVRHDHALLNTKVFSWDSPPVVDLKTGRRANPGEDFGCLPGDATLFCPVGIQKFYRRRYSGNLTLFITDSGKTLRTTPNHPVLTERGWIPANCVNIGDNIFKISHEGLFINPYDPENKISSFEEQFRFFEILPFVKRIEAIGREDFHSDVSVNEEVEIIDVKRILPDHIKPGLDKSFLENIFSESNEFFYSVPTSGYHHLLSKFPALRLAPDSVMRGLCQAFAFLFCGSGHAGEHGCAPVSWLNSVSQKVILDGLSLNAIFMRDGFNALSGDIRFYRLLFWEILCIVCDAMMTDCQMTALFKMHADSTCRDSGFLRNFPNIETVNIHANRIIDKKTICFSDHVYNLQTESGWYFADEFIVHNCRCVAIALIE
ncbi:MAG: minor capsid protein [Candidatus Acidiferrales bacterium]